MDQNYTSEEIKKQIDSLPDEECITIFQAFNTADILRTKLLMDQGVDLLSPENQILTGFTGQVLAEKGIDGLKEIPNVNMNFIREYLHRVVSLEDTLLETAHNYSDGEVEFVGNLTKHLGITQLKNRLFENINS